MRNLNYNFPKRMFLLNSMLCIGLFSYTGWSSSTPNEARIIKEVESALSEHYAAFFRDDVEGVVRSTAPDVIFQDFGSPVRIGHQGVRDYAIPFLGQFWVDSVRREIPPVWRVSNDGKIVSLIHTFKANLRMKEGNEPVVVRMQELMVFGKIDGKWLIISNYATTL